MRASFLALILALSTVSAHAEEAEKPAEPVYGWAHNAEASLLLTSGNTRVTTIGGAFESNFKSPLWASKGRVSYVQNSVAGTTQADLFTLDARGDRTVVGGLAIYVQAGFLRNPFAGFNSRTSGDVGARYTLLAGPVHSLATELGLGLVGENRTDMGANSFLLVKLGLEYKWVISPTAELTSTCTLLENLKTTNDLRFSNTTALSLVITKILSAKIGFRLDFLNAPVAGKVSTDTATTFALVAKF